MKPRTIAIVGLGLMGGSLGLALGGRRSKNVRLVGISRSAQKVRQAVRRGIIHAGTTSLRKGVAEADLVVIAAPVRAIPGIVALVDRLAPRGTVVTDVGSTKAHILRAINSKHLRHIQFVGSHPMAGSHETGLDAARSDLYQGACVFMVSSMPPTRAYREVSRMWRKAGARVIMVTAEAHDRIASSVSQLPHLLAAELMNSVPAPLLPFAGSGLRDTTRIAQGDPGLWIDIVGTNRTHLARDLKRYTVRLQKLISDLVHKRDTRIMSRLLQARRARRRLNHFKK